MAAFGGLITLSIDTAGQVVVQPVPVSNHVLREFEHDLVLFYTGIQRRATDILAQQGQAVHAKQATVSDSMHHIKAIGQDMVAALAAGQPDRVGELMHKYWGYKQQINPAMTPTEVNRWYNLARSKGALGGKLVGAGGGGFLLLYCPQDKTALRQAMAAEGLRELHFNFDFEGAKVILNLEERSWATAPTHASAMQQV